MDWFEVDSIPTSSFSNIMAQNHHRIIIFATVL